MEKYELLSAHTHLLLAVASLVKRDMNNIQDFRLPSTLEVIVQTNSVHLSISDSINFSLLSLIVQVLFYRNVNQLVFLCFCFVSYECFCTWFSSQSPQIFIICNAKQQYSFLFLQMWVSLIYYCLIDFIRCGFLCIISDFMVLTIQFRHFYLHYLLLIHFNW